MPAQKCRSKKGSTINLDVSQVRNWYYYNLSQNMQNLNIKDYTTILSNTLCGPYEHDCMHVTRTMQQTE
jgi:hypothetical protein